MNIRVPTDPYFKIGHTNNYGRNNNFSDSTIFSLCLDRIDTL